MAKNICVIDSEGAEELMQHIQAGNGVEISHIVMGINSYAAGIADQVFDRYRAAGGDTFDTARMYYGGECDRMLGEYVRKRGIRSQVKVCMKGCYPLEQSKMYLARLAPEDIRGDLEKSLRAFGTDYADLYLLHRDDPARPVEEIVPVMDALVREGKARAVGVSNWTCGRIAQANAFARENGLTPFTVSQLHFSLALTTPPLTGDITHVPMNATEQMWYEETGMTIMAFASQGKGFFAQYQAGGAYKPTVKAYYTSIPENLRRAGRCVEVGEKYGVSATVIALAYLLCHPLHPAAMCTYSKISQYEDSMRALEIPLTAAEVRYLETGK